jgi:uncharacterized protein YrzB (UPF0473 family)
MNVEPIQGQEKDIITVIDQNGQEREAEVIADFKLSKTGKQYIIYTFNEKDENDMITLHAGVIVEKDGMYSFEDIPTDEEWTTIKDIMKRMAQIEQA